MASSPSGVEAKKKPQLVRADTLSPRALKQNNNRRIILEDVNGLVRPGELCAILGSSGSGKTTLLDILAGNQDPTTYIDGDVLLGGVVRPKKSKRQPSQMAYVMQDDRLLPHLTARETLEYAARLRLPADWTLDMKLKRVDEVLSDLGLTHVTNSQVHRLSGGERRRVSIGVQLLMDPAIVLLDEPTSGLDSFTAHKVVRVLSELAKKRQRTIVCTLHQPSSPIFSLLDVVCLLSQGRVAYFGPANGVAAYFEQLGHACPAYVNPLDFYMDVISVDNRSTQSQEASWTRLLELQRQYQYSEVAQDFLKALDVIPTVAAAPGARPTLVRRVSLRDDGHNKAMSPATAHSRKNSLQLSPEEKTPASSDAVNLPASPTAQEAKEASASATSPAERAPPGLLVKQKTKRSLQEYKSHAPVDSTAPVAFFPTDGETVPAKTDTTAPAVFFPSTENETPVIATSDKAVAPAAGNHVVVISGSSTHKSTVSPVARPSFCAVVAILFSRAWVNLKRDANALQVRLAQMLFFGLLLFIFVGQLGTNQTSVQNRSGFLYQASSPMVFIGMMNAIALFPSLRNVYYRERKDGLYGPGVFLFSYFLHHVFFSIVAAASFSLFCYWTVGLHDGWHRVLIFVGVMSLLHILGEAIGVASLCLFFNVHLGNNVAALFCSLIFLLGAGFLRNVNAMPTWVRGLAWASPYRYASNLLVYNEFHDLSLHCDAGEPCSYTSGDQFIDYLFKDAGKYPGRDVGLIVAFMVIMELLAYVFLKFRRRSLR